MSQFHGSICQCVSYQCCARSTRGKSGKMVRGRLLSPSEHRRHMEEDNIRSAVRSETSFTYAREYDSTLLSFTPSPHWPAPPKAGPRDSHPTPTASAATITSSSGTPVVCFSVHDLDAINTDLTARMAEWQAQPCPTQFNAGPGTTLAFPHASHLSWLRLTLDTVREGDVGVDQRCAVMRGQLRHRLETQLSYLEAEKRRWDVSLDPGRTERVHHAAPPPPVFSWHVASIAAVVVFLAVLEHTFHLSERGLSFVAAFLRLLVDDITTTVNPLPPELSAIRQAFSELPKDIDTIRKKAGLAPEFVIFASCPGCAHLHAPMSSPDRRYSVYPKTCENRLSKSGRTYTCGVDLTKPVSRKTAEGHPIAIDVPQKPFAYASVMGCISRFLSSPTLANSMMQTSDKLASSTSRCSASPDTTLHDILDGTVCTAAVADLPEFSTPHPLLKLIFSLSVDWFHPRGASKRSHGSIGLISLVCLNLPPELRYAPENMHLVGVLPGPREGSDVQPFLAPLVDEFLELYQGCTITTPASNPRQRGVQAMLIPVVCDMPAARKVIGFVPPRATAVCPYCKCSYADLSKSSIIDGELEYRTVDEWKRHAKEYRKAKTKALRKELKKTNGVSSSQLLRLPYWDPTRFTVVDAMHNLLLGLIQYHVREVWQVEEATKTTKPVKRRTRASVSAALGTNKLRSQRPTAATIRSALAVVHNTSDPARWEKLNRRSIPILEEICSRLGLNFKFPGRKLKRNYIDVLKSWDSSRSAATLPTGDQPLPEPADCAPATQSHRLTPEELTRIREIIARVTLPGWIGQLSTDFGSATRGTPKSDEWRTAGTIHLPIALIQMWAGTERQQDLDWFLDLVTAVQLATRRSTSGERASAYLTHLRRYLHGLVQRGFSLRPNHHAALHLADFLPRFGPARGWWAYPVERQIGILQKITTNDRFGQMESTILTSHHRAAQIRTLIHSPHPDAAPVLGNTLDLARQVLSTTPLVSSLSTDTPLGPADPMQFIQGQRVDRTKLTRMTSEDYKLLQHLLRHEANPSSLNPKAQPLSRIQHGGVTFSIEFDSLDNSNVMFRGDDGQLEFGRILNILVHERRRGDHRVCETFVVLRRAISADEEEQTRYRSVHPSHCARLYRNYPKPGNTSRGGESVMVRLSSIAFHVATLLSVDGAGDERLLTWGLDRS